MLAKLLFILKKLHFPLLFSLLWTGVILFLSLAKMPEDDTIKIEIPHLDKIVHFFMYFIYTCILLMEWKKKGNKLVTLLTISYAILFGILMEFLQMKFFTYRTGEFFDVLFNSLGAVTAAFILPVLKKITKS